MFTGFNVVSQFKGDEKKFPASFSNFYDPNQRFDIEIPGLLEKGIIL